MSPVTELQTQGQPGTEVPQNKCTVGAKQFHQEWEGKKEMKKSIYVFFKLFFIAVIPSYYELRLGIGKILLLEILISSAFVLFLLVFMCSAVLPFTTLAHFSCQCFVSLGCFKLWFRKIVLLFTPHCPGFPNLPPLAFYVVTNYPEASQITRNV